MWWVLVFWFVILWSYWIYLRSKGNNQDQHWITRNWNIWTPPNISVVYHISPLQLRLNLSPWHSAEMLLTRATLPNCPASLWRVMSLCPFPGHFMASPELTPASWPLPSAPEAACWSSPVLAGTTMATTHAMPRMRRALPHKLPS